MNHAKEIDAFVHRSFDMYGLDFKQFFNELVDEEEDEGGIPAGGHLEELPLVVGEEVDMELLTQAATALGVSAEALMQMDRDAVRCWYEKYPYFKLRGKFEAARQQKYNALAEIRRRRKWIQMGQQLHKYENLLNREFQADRPNHKWVTDISYIHTGQGVLYLSMIRDLYDNSIVAYQTGTRQTVNLVLDTVRLAMKKEKKKVAAELQLHSNQGSQYTSRAYFNLIQSYGITPSMSRRGNCYDNAMAENFFSILKTECIYRLKPKTFAEARTAIDR